MDAWKDFLEFGFTLLTTSKELKVKNITFIKNRFTKETCTMKYNVEQIGTSVHLCNNQQKT